MYLFRFRYYNNHYLRKWLLRNSKESGNNGRKILATASKLDLKDAMNLVSKQQLFCNTEDNSSSRYLYNGDSNNNLDDDHKNNTRGGRGGGGGGAGGGACAAVGHGPSIFLTVPQANDRFALGHDEEALASLFRSFTQSNLAGLNDESPTLPAKIPKDEDAKLKMSIADDHSQVTISDDENSELGHILDEAMFKPVKHVSLLKHLSILNPFDTFLTLFQTPHYTRSDYSEEPQQHPPFQHQVRMHIRRMFSQSQKNRRRSTYANEVRRTKSDKKARRTSPNGRHRCASDAEKHEARKRNGDLIKKKPSKEENEDGDDEDEDGGIMFSANKEKSTPGSRESGLRSQREFPSWIDNREAVPDYSTPTNTLIQRIDKLESPSSSIKPNIREIFPDKKQSPKSSHEQETTFPIEKPPPTKSRKNQDKQSKSKKDSSGEQVVIRFHNTTSEANRGKNSENKNKDKADDDEENDNEHDEHVTISRL